MKKVLVSIFTIAMVLSWNHPAAGQAGSSLNDQLIQAATNGDTATVQQLLDQGANIEAKAENGGTALIWAANEGKTGVMKLLLEKGANIDASNDGITVLSLAEKNDNPAAAELLRAHGAH